MKLLILAALLQSVAFGQYNTGKFNDDEFPKLEQILIRNWKIYQHDHRYHDLINRFNKLYNEVAEVGPKETLKDGRIVATVPGNLRASFQAIKNLLSDRELNGEPLKKPLLRNMKDVIYSEKAEGEKRILSALLQAEEHLNSLEIELIPARTGEAALLHKCLAEHLEDMKSKRSKTLNLNDCTIRVRYQGQIPVPPTAMKFSEDEMFPPVKLVNEAPTSMKLPEKGRAHK